MVKWINAEERKPETKQRVLVVYNPRGSPKITMGWYTPAKTIESSSFDGETLDEYDEETDTYYLQEQWVDESVESEYHYSITGVTHWMELPELPEMEELE